MSFSAMDLKNMTSIINKTPALFAALLLSACGGSDDSSSGTGYIQFYNASANAPKVFLEIDDAVRTGANFGNVTTRHSYNNENYELDYQYLNDNNDYVSVFDNTEVLTIENDEKTLKVLSGDFSNPQIHSFQIPEFDEEDEFKIGIINTISDSTEYDVYVAKEGYDFVDAELVQSTNYLALNDLETVKEDSYHFYVTEQGSQTPVFQSELVHFDDQQSYVTMIRKSYSANSNEITLDIVSDNSSVHSLSHVNALSQLRFYNAIDTYEQVKFIATSTQNDVETDLTDNDTLTNYHSVNAGNFSISMYDINETPLLTNYLEAIGQSRSLLNIVYQHKSGYPAMISIDEELSPNQVSHQVQIVNLIDSSPYNNDINEVSIYFTEGSETIEETTTYLKDIDNYDSKALSLDSQSYDVTVTYEVNDQVISLLQLADMEFTQTGNYILILEQDATTASGYKITKINTLAP